MLGIVPYNSGEGAAHEYPASGGETMKPAFELAAFTVRDGAEAAMLAERQAMIGSLSQAFPGLLAAWLTQRDDGSWLDVIEGVVPAHRRVARPAARRHRRSAAVRPDPEHTMRVIQGTGTLCEVYPVRRCGTIKRWPVHERIELPHLIHRTGHHVHHTTGFDREEIIDLCIRINSVQPGAGSPNWPPCLGLFKSVVAALTYMRHNRTQAEIGESLGVSQPTISRAISAITPLVPEATREFVPAADDLDSDAQYILDGTLLPCWSWDGHKELYSGKHKTTGMNLQVACTIYGKLAWISDPVNGSRHDNYCREESGVLLTINPRNWIGDKGYIGNNMITPFRKPAGGELLDWQKEYNSEVNKIRWMIEQVISHFKNWTIMHTDYRRPLKTFETTISAVVGLHFYRTV